MKREILVLLLLLLLQNIYAAFVRHSVNGTFSLFICDLQAPPGLKFVGTSPSLILDGNSDYFSFDRVGDHLDPSRYQGFHYPNFTRENLVGAILVHGFNSSDFENISCFQFLDDDTIIKHTLINNYSLQPAVTTPATFSTTNVSISPLQTSIFPVIKVTYVISKMSIIAAILGIGFTVLTCCVVFACYLSCYPILFGLIILFCSWLCQTPNSADNDDNNSIKEGNITREEKTQEQSKSKPFHNL